MPLDPTKIDLENLNPFTPPITPTNKSAKVVLFTLFVTTVLVAAGLYLYNNNLNNDKTN